MVSYLKSIKFHIYRSKKEGVKITSLLNTILWTATLRLFKKHNDTADKILAWTAVSLRRYRPESEINKYMLGYCVGSFFDVFPNAYDNVLDDSDVAAKFWTLARQNDVNLTDKVANSSQKFGIKMKSPMIGDEMGFHVGFSSVGLLETDEIERGGVFTIENAYINGYIPEQNTRYLTYSFSFTIKNQVFWGTMSNSRFFDHRLVEEQFEIFQHIVTILIDSNN